MPVGTPRSLTYQHANISPATPRTYEAGLAALGYSNNSQQITGGHGAYTQVQGHQPWPQPTVATARSNSYHQQQVRADAGMQPQQHSIMGFVPAQAVRQQWAMRGIQPQDSAAGTWNVSPPQYQGSRTQSALTPRGMGQYSPERQHHFANGYAQSQS